MRTTTISAFFYVSVCCHILSSSSQRAALALSVFVVGCVHYSICSQPGCRSPMVREHALFVSIFIRSPDHFLLPSSFDNIICSLQKEQEILDFHGSTYKALTTCMQVKLRPQKCSSLIFS